MPAPDSSREAVAAAASRRWLIPCAHAVRLASEREDRTLRPGEWLRLRLHLVVCRMCRLFSRQVGGLRGWSVTNGPAIADSLGASLTPEVRARMKQRLKAAP